MQTPKADAEQLLNDMMPFAEKMLSEHGEFLPFGAGMKPDGTIVWIAARDEREQPPSSDIIQILADKFRLAAREGIYDATAIVYDVRISDPKLVQGDAVLVSLDHRGGFSATILFPYKIHEGVVRFDDARREPNSIPIFSA